MTSRPTASRRAPSLPALSAASLASALAPLLLAALPQACGSSSAFSEDPADASVQDASNTPDVLSGLPVSCDLTEG